MPSLGLALGLPFQIAKAGAAPAPVVIPVDMFWSGEAGTAGDAMTSTLMTSVTTEKYPIGAWSLTAEAQARMTVEAAVNELPYAIRVGATGFLKTGWARGLSTLQTYDSNYAKNLFGASSRCPSRVSASGFIRVTDGIDVNRDALILTKAGGGFVVLATRLTNFRIHGDNTPTFGADIAFTPGAWYFFTILALRSGTSKLRIYTAAGVYVGESTIASTDNTGFIDVRVGRADATGDFIAPNNVGSIQLAHIMIDHTRGIYPLGIEYNAANYPTVSVLDDSDSFDRTNAPSLGAGWTDQKAGISIAGNKAVASSYDALLPFAYKNGTFDAQQYSEAVIDTVSNAEMVGVSVRCSGVDAAANAICYVARSGIQRYIQSITNGVATNMFQVTFTAWAIGDTVRLIADGSFIGLYRKPSGGSFSLIGSAWLNGTHAAGNPGIMLGKAAVWATDGKALSWAGGNLVT